MFIKIMLSYVLGYLKLSVEGYYIERFINICKNNKITIWNLKRNKERKEGRKKERNGERKLRNLFKYL